MVRIEGQVIEEGGDFTLGQELTTVMGLDFPGRGWEESEDNHPIAGEYDAIGLDLQGVSFSQLTALKTKIEQTKTKLDQYQAHPSDPAPISDITKEDISGDLLYAGILGYFASVDSSDQLAAKANQNIVAYRLPSFGIFLVTAQPHYWFGIARNVTFPSMVLDVDKVTYHVEAKDANNQNRLSYMRQVGSTGSAFEHAVPERLFLDPSLPIDDSSQPQGISAVKALSIASSQGQKIYTLNSQNQAYHSTIIAGLNTDADTKIEISNALEAGKEVTIHQSDITFSGWTGSGYIIIDPDTGAGAYKIGGGANGGAVAGIGIVSTILAISGASTVAPFLLGLWIFVSISALLINALYEAILIVDEGGPCAVTLSKVYLAIATTLVALSTIFGLPSVSKDSGVAKFVLKLMGSMYGSSKLFKSVTNGCQ